MDVAQLGIVVELKGGAVTAKGLDDIAKKGSAAETAMKKTAASVADFARAGANANQIANLTGTSLKNAAEAVKRYGNAAAESEGEVRGLKAANEELAAAGVKVTQAATRANPAINSLRGSLTTMTASALQAAPGVGALTGVLGSMAIGAGPMVAILAGVAALTFAWQKLTEGARKAKEEHEKLRNVLKSLVDSDKFTVTKALADEATNFRKLSDELAKVEARWANLKAQGSGGGLAAAGFEREIARLKREIEESKTLVLRGVQEVTKDQVADYNERIRAANAAAEAAARALETYKHQADALAIAAFEAERIAKALAGIEARGIPGVQFIQQGIIGPSAAPLPGFPAPAVVDEYMDDIRRIWGDGIGKIITDGFKSFHDLFEDVLQLFSNLLKRMQAAGNASGIGGKLLGVGSAGIAGGLAGYSTGSQFSSGGVKGALLGSATGAASGALAGFAVGGAPGAIVGTVVGEIAGLVGALRSGSVAAKQRKEAENALRDSLAQSIATQKLLLGIITPLDAALQENATTFKKLREAVEAAYAGRKNEAEREAKLRELAALESQRAAQIQAEAAKEAEEAAKRLAAEAEAAAQAQRELAESIAAAAAAAAEAARKLNQSSQRGSLLRFYDATGQADLAFALGQLIEINEAIADGLDQLSIDLLRQAQAAEKDLYQQSKADAAAAQQRQAQTELLQNQAQSLQQSVSAQQEIVNNTRQTYEALRKYADSLSLSDKSPLSPVERYNEAKRQYLAISNAAAGGDLNAAQRLPEVANAFLQESKNMFASTSRYVDDFKQVQAFVGAITDKFGTQLSVEERMLSTLQAQLGALQQQIDLLREVKTNTGETATILRPLPDVVGGPYRPKLPPDDYIGTDPIRRRIPVRDTDDLYNQNDRIINYLYNLDQKGASHDYWFSQINQRGAETRDKVELVRVNTRETADNIRNGIVIGGGV